MKWEWSQPHYSVNKEKSVTQMTSFTRRVIFDYSRLRSLSNFQPRTSSTYCSIVGASAREGILDLKAPHHQ